jgi:prolyl-tRNA editing enzyme YbaK/EbsC (Cys-tRNA(Pro) deacylase)
MKASVLAGEALGKADADLVRAQTGFVIGGVAPVGHLHPIRAWFDPRLLDFDVVWAAAGTPRHVFPIAPGDLLRISGAQQADFTVSESTRCKKDSLEVLRGGPGRTYRVM